MGRIIMEKMTIDPEQVTNIIVAFLKKQIEEQKRNGIALGLSGGVDSAVAAALSVKAVGAANVYALHLFDRDSQAKFLKYAQKVAEMLKINLEVRDITPLVKGQGAYKPLMVKITAFSPVLNRFIIRVFRFISYRLLRRSPYSLVLEHGQSVKHNRFGRKIYQIMADTLEAGFNARHMQRRQILEKYASEKNLLLIGAANKSESMVGWFVKDGVDDIPVEPILGLYKNQVRQLARFLGIPSEIVDQVPSPDMMRGVGDELVVGFPYDKIDVVSYVLERGLSPEMAFAEGITPAEFEGIKTLNRLSAWKRANKHEYPILA